MSIGDSSEQSLVAKQNHQDILENALVLTHALELVNVHHDLFMLTLKETGDGLGIYYLLLSGHLCEDTPNTVALGINRFLFLFLIILILIFLVVLFVTNWVAEAVGFRLRRPGWN